MIGFKNKDIRTYGTNWIKGFLGCRVWLGGIWTENKLKEKIQGCYNQDIDLD